MNAASCGCNFTNIITVIRLILSITKTTIGIPCYDLYKYSYNIFSRTECKVNLLNEKKWNEIN